MAGGDFLSADEERRLVELIKTVERKTTGEVHVHIARKLSRKGVLADAAKAFSKLSIDKTRQRNGVLIYIVERDRELACLGDSAIHEKVKDEGWKSLVDELRARFAKGERFEGLRVAVERIGAILAEHFPPDGTESENELPDEISKS